ncbi:MAG: hypothetical protein ABMA25_07685 [Ilumatobacteraceae bacterium]
MSIRRLFLTAAAALAAPFLTFGSTAAAPNVPPPTLSVVADGCEFTFTTVGGQGAADGWSASFSVDGNDAGTWGSSNDVEVLTNWISRDFAPGGTLTVTWEVFALPANTSLSTGTTVLAVPACDPPYQIRIDKVVTGQTPSAGYTVRLWGADGDGGTSCAPVPDAQAFTVALPAAGGSALVRATPGQWCVQESERRGALTTTYSSSGGSMLGEAHLVTVPPAPGTTVVTITNTFAASAAPTTPTPTLPSTGGTDAVAWWAGALIAIGAMFTRLARPTVA